MVQPPNHRPHLAAALASVFAGWLLAGAALAQDHAPASGPGKTSVAEQPASSASAAKRIGQQVREALITGIDSKKRITLGVVAAGAAPANALPVAAPKPAPNATASRKYIRARAAALAGHEIAPASADDAGHGMGEVHWSYEGAGGPQAWGRLKPEYATCDSGKRQSPINIDQTTTLRGPAEVIQFDYRASSATVVNNGHTIQVDVTGDNGIVVRGSRFQLLQLHFHHPSEEKVNYRGFAMVAHLVHRNHLGQLAVVAVLLEPGAANPVVNAIWTYMPLDTDDRVPMPAESIELAKLLPTDQRYYQFMGSLTTPPCSEDVLWMVLKQPVTISQDQLRLFAQLFPHNARPVQPLNGRAVRDGQ